MYYAAARLVIAVVFSTFECTYIKENKIKLQVKLADPDVVSNPSEYQKLAQSVAELDEVMQFIFATSHARFYSYVLLEFHFRF